MPRHSLVELWNADRGVWNEEQDCRGRACPERPSRSGSTELTAGFDRPVLSFVEGLRTSGWGVEGLALPEEGAARRPYKSAFRRKP